LKGEIEKNNNFYKKANKKTRNKKKWEPKWKHNTINLDWRIKLQTNKTFTKRAMKKYRNQKNKKQIRKYNI